VEKQRYRPVPLYLLLPLRTLVGRFFAKYPRLQKQYDEQQFKEANNG